MRSLGVYVDFLNDLYIQQINELASLLGFDVTYYNPSDINETSALRNNIAKFEILFGHVPAEFLQEAKNLKWICSDFAGIEKYLPNEVWPNQSCLLTNSSGAYGISISEHIIMVLLMLMRRMSEYIETTMKHEWAVLSPIRGINDSKITILGTGDIGSNAARRLKHLGATITGVCRSGKTDEKSFDRILPISKLDYVLPESQVLILALPETKETIGILNQDRISLLPRDCLIINVGRGSAIDQDALISAMNNHEIAGAALDVMTPEPLPKDHPLWKCPNIIITPHVSGNMALGKTCDIVVDMFCENFKRYVHGERLYNLVDRSQGY